MPSKFDFMFLLKFSLKLNHKFWLLDKNHFEILYNVEDTDLFDEKTKVAFEIIVFLSAPFPC